MMLRDGSHDARMLDALLTGERDDPLTHLILDGNLDELGPFATLALGHWWNVHAPRDARQHANAARLQGIRRKTVARNRLLARSLAHLRDAWSAAAIPSLALKGLGLLDGELPATGLRPFHDLDVWIAPRDTHRAIHVAKAHVRRADRHAHSLTITLPDGTPVDLHTYPSRWHARTLPNANAGNALFDAVWARSHEQRMHRVDLLHLSFLNRFFHEPPGSPQATFAWIELDTILRAGPLSASDAAAWRAHMTEDGSAPVFLEHGAWLGARATEPLTAFLDGIVSPAVTPEQRTMLAHHAQAQAASSWDHGLRRNLRRRMLLGTPPRQARRLAMQDIAHGIARTVFGEPSILLRWLTRPRSWRRLRTLIRNLLRAPTGST